MNEIKELNEIEIRNESNTLKEDMGLNKPCIPGLNQINKDPNNYCRWRSSSFVA